MSGDYFIFYYDVVCPYAYMASRQVEAVGRRAGAQVIWRPVLLGKEFSYGWCDQRSIFGVT